MGLLRLLLVIALGMYHGSSIAAYSPFRAHVDKNRLNTQESIVLTLEFEGKAGEEPDLSPLSRDFSIVSRQQSHSSTFNNGNYSAKTAWILELVPKHRGKSLTIPSLKLGNYKTEPIDIVLTDTPSAVNSDEILFAVTTDRDQVYVNGELILNIHIKTPLLLRQGSLSNLEMKDVIIEPLVEEQLSEVVEQGIKYYVFKKSYAIFPSVAKDIVIPPLTFSGLIADNRRGANPWSGFFAQGKKIRTSSKAIAIKVKDVPAQFPSGHQFLPLKSFVVIEAFDEPDPKFEVGKATTRRFEMKAKGTVASFLPTVGVPDVAGLSVYAESGQKMQKSVEDGMEASVKFSHVYMPTAPGQITVPEHVIYWWDIHSDTLQTTVIRSLPLNITGTAQPVATPPSNVQAPVPDSNSQEQAEETGNDTQGIAAILWGGTAALALLLAVLLYWYWRKRAKGAQTREAKLGAPEQLQILVKDVAKACDKGDAKETYRRLQALLRHDIARDRQADLLGPDLTSRIGRLEKALFDSGQTENTDDLLREIKRGLGHLEPNGAKKRSSLKPLYPV